MFVVLSFFCLCVVLLVLVCVAVCRSLLLMCVVRCCCCSVVSLRVARCALSADTGVVVVCC